MRALFVFVPVLILGLPFPLFAEPATERYAPAQLRAAQDLLERARAHAALGEHGAAATLARQARFDAGLAWGMSESEQLRAEAAAVGGEANALVSRLVIARE